MGLRGQSSAEYLSNYTIAAIVIVAMLAAFTYLGVWDLLLNKGAPICIFQKGLLCDSYYLKSGDDIATLKILNEFNDAIVIKGVICSGEAIDPATGLPQGRTFAGITPRPQVDGVAIPITPPPPYPTIPKGETFELKTPCYIPTGAGVGSTGTARFVGIVFIRYQLNSSPSSPIFAGSFEHTIQGNLQSSPN
jgi:hypothetical protein